jgi:DNA-binding NarL/FixJ family response regulator
VASPRSGVPDTALSTCALLWSSVKGGISTSNHRVRAAGARTEQNVSSGSIRVLLAEAQRLFRQSLHRLLEREHDITAVLEASDAQEVCRLTAAHRPDIVLLDVDMPDLDAASVTHLLHKHHPKTRVLLLARYDEDARIVAAMRAGAFGYILKDADWADFLRILRATANGEQVLSPIMPDRLVNNVPGSLRHSHESNALRLSTLSDRERQILACAAAGQSNKEVADHLCVSVDTVKTHLHHIYQKLSVSGRVEAVIAFLHAQ